MISIVACCHGAKLRALAALVSDRNNIYLLAPPQSSPVVKIRMKTQSVE